MTTDSRQCDEIQILRFLKGELDAIEEREFETHLGVCNKCRHQLDGSTASGEQWQSAGAYLRDEAIDMESLSTMLTRSDESELTQEVLDDGVRRVVELLHPTDDPKMLGRIGGYEVVGVIGSGGNGIVLKGHDRALNRFVAIKVLAPHLASSGAARKRFAREAQAAAAVVHENVIAIHGVSESHTLPYLVMPYVRGTSLQSRIDQDGPLELMEVLRIGMQMAAGLSAAHAQGLVHRDIKPANILLADGVERVTITDFGLARAADDASMTRSGMIAGTPQFMSPEQARGDAIDHRSDLFSLGSVLYSICTGHPPFRSESSYGMLKRICESKPRPIRESNSNTPEWLCHLIARLHAKDPNDRFHTAAEVAELLSQCLAHVQQPDTMALPIALRERRATPHVQRRSVLVVVASGVALALVTLAAVALRNNGDRKLSSERPVDVSFAEASAQMPDMNDHELDWDDNVSASILEVDHDVKRLEERAKLLFGDRPDQP